MKFLFVLGALCLAGAYGQDVTCDECKDAVGKLQARLLGEASLAEQSAILVETLCPTSPDPAKCEAVISTHWALIAGATYPALLNDDLCMTLGSCTKAALGEWTCENCVDGINNIGMILTADETVAAVIDLLKGEAFCGQEAAPETCPDVVDILVPAALPVLAGVLAETAPQICLEELQVC